MAESDPVLTLDNDDDDDLPAGHCRSSASRSTCLRQTVSLDRHYTVSPSTTTASWCSPRPRCGCSSGRPTPGNWFVRRFIADVPAVNTKHTLCYAFSTRWYRWRLYMFSGRPSLRSFVRLFVRSSDQILLPRYLMNAWSNLDETYREYSTAPTDNLIRFWRSKIKGQGHSRPPNVHVDAVMSKSIKFTLTSARTTLQFLYSANIRIQLPVWNYFKV